MKQFQDVVKEVNRTLNELILFDNIVNTTIVFLVFYLVLTLIDFSPLLALIPALAYLVFYSYISLKSSKPHIVESMYAPLREYLRTAADNVGMENPIGENFLSIKQLAEKIVSIVGKGNIKIIPYPSERRIVEPGHFAADITKISQIGWKPKISLEEGLRRTIEWKIKNP